jgi:hypothetical protein
VQRVGPEGSGPMVAAWAIGVGLSASCAAATRHALVLDDLAIRVVLGLDNGAKDHPAAHAGARTLEAGVVRLYGVVVIVRGWVRMRCARLSGVHSSVPTFLWAGLRGAPTPPGPSFYPTRLLYQFHHFLQQVSLKFF